MDLFRVGSIVFGVDTKDKIFPLFNGHEFVVILGTYCDPGLQIREAREKASIS